MHKVEKSLNIGKKSKISENKITKLFKKYIKKYKDKVCTIRDSKKFRRIQLEIYGDKFVTLQEENGKMRINFVAWCEKKSKIDENIVNLFFQE